jgi:hypothetical protein
MTKSLLVVPVALILGCAHRPPEAAASISECSGRRVAVVTNRWSESVDVFSRIGETPSQSGFYVGTVAAGRQDQFPLPAGARFVSLREVGSTATQPSVPAPSRNLGLVDVGYRCE